MKKSTSQSSTSNANRKLAELVKQHREEIKAEIADARICNDIAFSLYDLRLNSSMTQKQLAQRLGVQQSNISRWEQAGYQGYKIKMLSKIVRALGGRLYVGIFPPITSAKFFTAKFTEEFTQNITINNIDGSSWNIKTNRTKNLELEGVEVGYARP